MKTKGILSFFIALLFALSCLLIVDADARGRRSSGRHSSVSHSQSYKSGRPTSGYHKSTRSSVAARDARGRIKRSAREKHAFQRNNPCPSTGKKSGACPGYVIDHVVPLKRGGPDSPGNMQWQTRAEAKAKDKWE